MRTTDRVRDACHQRGQRGAGSRAGGRTGRCRRRAASWPARWVTAAGTTASTPCSPPTCTARSRRRSWRSRVRRSRSSSTGACASATTAGSTRQPAAEMHRDRARYLDAPYPGGESWREAIDRVGRFLADLPTRWDGKRVLVIGHVATRWGLDHFLNGRSPRGARRRGLRVAGGMGVQQYGDRATGANVSGSRYVVEPMRKIRRARGHRGAWRERSTTT